MKVLVIGSEGFIGSHCVSYYINKKYTVTGCDLLDYNSNSYEYFKLSRLKPGFEDVLNNRIYDICINAAGNGNVQTSINHPLTDFDANCSDVIHILEKLRIHSPGCKYVHISSAAVYGNPSKLPISENDELKPISPYGWHKLISEKICEEYAYLHQMKVAILRPFSVYGEGLRKQLFWDLYQKVLKNPNEVEIFGNGSESRDFIYIKDLVCLIDLIVSKAEMRGERYNATNGEEVFISSIVEKFINYLSPATKIQFTKRLLAGSPINWKADINKITKLGYKPNYDLEKGLINLTSWMKNLK